MKLVSINIQGNIFTSEILEKIRQNDIRYQEAQDFNLRPNESVKDEISNSWNLLNTHWQIFKKKRENFTEADTGTTETRNNWILPFLGLLGYEISKANAEIVNQKSYAISHHATNKDEFPIHIVGSEQSLEKRVQHGIRLSPHALMQEYINSTEHVYGVVTNGLQLRLLRDATKLSRLSYVEFNLEQMMEEGQYAEFAILYRLLHATRIANKKDEAADSILEFYHDEALASGSRIRERLSEAVEYSILNLANGLLQQYQNEELRRRFEDDELKAKDFYHTILRLIYRILFLLVIEERQLVYKSDLTEEKKKLKDFYYRFYSIQRLTFLVDKSIYIDPKKIDLWQSIQTTFRLFEDEEFGKKLGISALGSGIFSVGAMNNIYETVLSNRIVLDVFKHLVTFQNENKQRIRVNYADLDVEEFGSVYEGLLEYEPVVKDNYFTFQKGEERGSSGSHYTPEELVKPLIDHSLEYIIADKLKEENREKALLSISVCDVACGSGHILLSAARRIGFELAKVRSGEDQPTPSNLRLAIRDAIRHCIYGVDLNPLAVELCKVALWLEAHEPGEPLNFLDHRIKNGNAIVGLAHYKELENGIATEAFKTLPDDNKEIAKAFRDRNKLEVKTKGQTQFYDLTQADDALSSLQNEFEAFTKMPEHTPEQIEAKEKAYKRLTHNKKWWRLKQLADLQIAQFFIPKTQENKECLTTQSTYRTYLNTGTQIKDRGKSLAVSNDNRFFHWFLEFPEIFAKGGFDCILGNPPYLGGLRISTKLGDVFLNYIKTNYKPNSTTTDLVAYFMQRIHQIIKTNRFLAIITTNTISQGDTRIGSLDAFSVQSSSIIYALSSIRWPGTANLNVSLLSIYKGTWNSDRLLDNKKVNFISSYLSDEKPLPEPKSLFKNKNIIFNGSYYLGDGFVISKEEYNDFLTEDSKNSQVIFPLLIGRDINQKFNQTSSNYIINFFDWSIKEASEFSGPFQRVKKTVKPFRDKNKRAVYRNRWWIYGERRVGLYEKIQNLEYCFVITATTKYLNVVRKKTNKVFAKSLYVFSTEKFSDYSVVQSNLHNLWVRRYSSTLGNTLSYTPSTCFETFPFPLGVNEFELEEIGLKHHNFRKKCLNKMELNITHLYNLFHTSGIQNEINCKDKQVRYLKKHLEKIEDTVSFEEAIKGILELRQLHVQLDNTVLEAYGWTDINLRHDFYEVDYLPENDRVRFTIHPDARKEILKRLLELNHKLYQEEVDAGLWDKKKPKKKKKKTKSSKSSKQQTHQVREESAVYNTTLFDEPNLFNQAQKVEKECKVVLQLPTEEQFRYHITPNAQKGKFTQGFKQISSTSKLAELLIGKAVGDKVEFGKNVFEVVGIE